MQEITYWTMVANSYKFGLSGPGGTSYYGHSHAYEVNDHVPRVNGSRRVWENSSAMNNEESTPNLMPERENASTTMHASPEECKLALSFVLLVYLLL